MNQALVHAGWPLAQGLPVFELPATVKPSWAPYVQKQKFRDLIL
jgi:hypothetical protein